MSKKRKGTKTSGVSLITLGDKKSPISEQYRTIRTNIQFAMVDNQLRTLAITSTGPSEGKSTTSANLAVVFANSGLRVLLVDADMRKPTVAKTFKLENKKGLSNLLVSRDVDVASVCQASGVGNLAILTSGPKPPNPSELLSSNRMMAVMEEMKEIFDLVIFDMPPAVAVTDAQIVAAQVDGTVLVVREGVTNKAALARTKHLLDLVDATILGAVYNGTERSNSENYYYYYGE